MMFFQFRYSLMLTMTGLAHGVIVTIFKRLIFSHAGRPITYLDADLLYQVPGVSIHKWMSFPSGHTATIFAFIVLLSLLFKNRWITFLLSLIAILAGLSRIYLLQHFGVDVAVGAFIGTLTSVISYLTLHSASQPVWLVNKLSLSKFSSRKSMLMNTLRQRLNL
jgi:membrane-associated phospholipid phosphatase